MSHPDTDEGWFILVHALDGALACADFTKGARIVIHEVFAQIYGPAKRKRAVLSPTDLGKRFGRDKQYFGRAIRELVTAGALEKFPTDYKWIKYYQRWTNANGSPRFTQAEREVLKAAAERAMWFKTEDDKTYQPNQHKMVGNRVDASTESPTSPSTESPTGVGNLVDDSSTELMTNPSRDIGGIKGKRGREEPAQFIGSQKQRTPEDLKLIHEAIVVLKDGIDTQIVSMDIGRNHLNPSLVDLPGWKWLESAHRLLTKPASLQRKWTYYIGIVKGLADDEHPSLAKSHHNGSHAPSKPPEPTVYFRADRTPKGPK